MKFSQVLYLIGIPDSLLNFGEVYIKF